MGMPYRGRPTTGGGRIASPLDTGNAGQLPAEQNAPIDVMSGDARRN